MFFLINPYAMPSSWFLVSGTGTYVLSGQVALTLIQKKLVASQGTYTVDGQSIALYKGVVATADVGMYVLSGQITTLAAALKVAAAQGSYSLVGQAAALIKQFLMVGGHGTYSLTGIAAGLIKAFRLTADVGNYSVSGQDTLLYRIITLVSAYGSYTVTGQAANLIRQLVLPASYGSFAVGGQAATLRKDSIIGMEQGSYTVTGQDVVFLKSILAASDYGSYTVTGQAVNFLRGLAAAADVGSYTVGGQAAGFLKTTIMPVDFAPYSLTGQAVNLITGKAVVGDLGSYGLTGQDVAFMRALLVGATQGAYSVNGQAVAFNWNHPIVAAYGAYALTGQANGFLRSLKLAANYGQYAVTGDSETYTVTRTGSKWHYDSTGTFAQFATNVAARTDKGLSVDRASENLFAYSCDIAGHWTPLGSPTVTAGAAIPGSGFNFTSIDHATNSTTNYVFGQAFTAMTAGVAHVWSFLFMQGTRSDLYMQVDDQEDFGGNRWKYNFNFATGLGSVFMSNNKGNGGSLVGGGTVYLGGGIWRGWLSWIPAASSKGTFMLREGGGGTIIVGGMQVEQGTVPTAVKFTNGATETSNADVVTLTFGASGSHTLTLEYEDGYSEDAVVSGTSVTVPTSNARGVIRRIMSEGRRWEFDYPQAGTSLQYHRKFAMGQGSLVLTGQAANLVTARRGTSAQGSITLTGQAIGFIRGLKVGASVGSYVVTGQNESYSYTRAGSKWGLDASGVLQTFAADALPRTDLGVAVEPEAVNKVPNSTFAGGTAGTIGSGGVLPTGVERDAVGGVNLTVAYGTEDGRNYMDVEWAGTSTNGSYPQIHFMPKTAVVAAQGSTWTGSYEVKLISGSLANLDPIITIFEWSAAGGYLFDGHTSIVPTATRQKYTITRTLQHASVGRVGLAFGALQNVGSVINAKFRVYMPQLEAGTVATSFIKTAGSEVTRQADALVLNFGVAGTHDVRYEFDDGSVQESTLSGSSPTVPTNLNRPIIRRIISEGRRWEFDYPQDVTNLVYAGNTSVVAAQGGLTLSGQNAGLNVGRVIAAAQGSLTLSGQDATLRKGSVLAAAQGGLTLSGQDAGLLKGYRLFSDYTTYTLSGQAAGVAASRLLTADFGAYSVSGQDATIVRALLVEAAYGGYILTGQDLLYIRNYMLSADYTPYVLSGVDLGLLRQAFLTAGYANYVLTGEDAGLGRQLTVLAAQGSYALSGQDAALTKASALSIAATATTNVNGNSTTHTLNLPSGIVSGSLVLIYNTVSGGSATTQTISGWTKLFDHGGVGFPNFAAWYRFCDGSEGSTVSVSLSAARTFSLGRALRLTGHHASQAPEVSTRSTGSTASPDPPSLTPSWGSAANMWIALTGNNQGVLATGYPSGYTDNQDTSQNSPPGYAMATKIATATSDDAGAFTLASTPTNTLAFTTAVRSL